MLFIDNKYTYWYYKIISAANLRTLPNNTYTERHHVIPVSMGGDNSNTNLVNLTAREHFVCHVLLTKMTSGIYRHKMMSAVTRFQQQTKHQSRVLNSWEYKKLRECANLARKGVRHTEEAKKKIKDKHHNVSGANNPRARLIQATDPNGNVYQIHGTLKNFCKENGLAYSSALRLLSVHAKWKRAFKGSTQGWSFIHLD